MKLIDRDEAQIECCNCYWKGNESDKLNIRIDDDYLIFNQVCPNCKGEDFYLSTIPKVAEYNYNFDIKEFPSKLSELQPEDARFWFWMKNKNPIIEEG